MRTIADGWVGTAAKASPFAWPAWREGRPEWRLVDYETYAREGFNINAWVYGAIMYKVRSMTAAPLRAWGGDRDHPEPLGADDPLTKLVDRPNPWQSWSTLHGLNIAYFNLAGECFIFFDRPKRGGLPEAMYTLRPDRVAIVPTTAKAVASVNYLYVPEGASAWYNSTPQERRERLRDGAALPVLAEDLAHVKLPNPLDPLEGMGHGLSPVSPAAYPTDIDNTATKFLRDFFRRGLMPNVIITSAVPVDDAIAARIRARWAEIYGGPEGWLKPGVLDPDTKVDRLGYTFEEMGFAAIDRRDENRIIVPFGVPGALVGTTLGLERATYSNLETLERWFWNNTMIPESRWFETALRYHLQGEKGEFVGFDFSRIPALQKNVPALTEAAHRMWQMGVPANVAFQTVGLPVEGIPGGDVGYLPLGVVPASAPAPKAPRTEEGAAEAEEDARAKKALARGKRRAGALTEEAKATLWKAMDRQATAWEGRFEEAAGRALGADLKAILAIISKVGEEKAVAWGLVLLAVTDYLAMAGRDNWRKEFAPVVSGLVAERGEQLNAEFGMEFDVGNVLTTEFLESYTMPFAEAVCKETGETLNGLFAQAMEEGWSVPTTEKYLETLFQQWMDGDLSAEAFAWLSQRMPAWRREMIARSESIRASNRGADALYKAWGVQLKEWWSTEDERRCFFCAEMHGKVVKTGGNFWNKGDTMTVEVDGKPQTIKLDYEDVISPPLHPS